MSSDELRIMGILIGGDLDLRCQHGSKLPEDPIPADGTKVLSGPVFFTGSRGEESLCGHLTHLKTQDLPATWVHCERHTQGFALGVFGRLEIIELTASDGFFRKGTKPGLVLPFGLSREEPEFPDDGLRIHAKDPGGPSLGDPRAEESAEDDIDSSFFLGKAGMARCTREVSSAGTAEESLDVAAVGGAVEEAVSDHGAGIGTQACAGGGVTRAKSIRAVRNHGPGESSPGPEHGGFAKNPKTPAPESAG